MPNTLDVPSSDLRSDIANENVELSKRVEEDDVRASLRQVIDPEIGLNIVDLGLVYDIEVDGHDVHIQMTLTSPGCPMGPYIVSQTKQAAKSLGGVESAEVTLVWEPYWTSDRIDARVRALMGY